MRKPSGSQHWLLGSMSRNMRRIATVLSTLTLVISLVFAGLLYRVGTTPIPVKTGIVVTADASVGNEELIAPDGTNATDVPEGAEQIADEDVPLAAPGAQKKNPPISAITVVLGFGLGLIVVFFARRIYRVNASIDAMNQKTR